MKNNRVYKKRVNNEREINNLKFLSGLNNSLIPEVKKISGDYVLIEKCNKLCVNDFLKIGFKDLYFKLLIDLYRYKRNNFTPGIYKYFTPEDRTSGVKNQKYIPHIMNCFNSIVRRILYDKRNLKNNTNFVKMIRHLHNSQKRHIDWEPDDGYSLLHGDLHLDNIVRRDNKYLFIDVEYLRYGAVEIEIANFLISVLIHVYRYFSDMSFIIQLGKQYLAETDSLSLVDNDIIHFFWNLSIALFYITFYIQEDEKELKLLDNLYWQVFF